MKKVKKAAKDGLLIIPGKEHGRNESCTALFYVIEPQHLEYI